MMMMAPSPMMVMAPAPSQAPRLPQASQPISLSQACPAGPRQGAKSAASEQGKAPGQKMRAAAQSVQESIRAAELDEQAAKLKLAAMQLECAAQFVRRQGGPSPK